jgi:hypothetical protein
VSRIVAPTEAMRSVAPELIDALVPVHIAETEAERDAIFAFRYSVYAEELGRKLGNADHERGHVHDPEDDQAYTTLLYTEDEDGRVTGTSRIRHWDPGQVPDKDWATFSMEQFDGIERLTTAELGRLMIAPGHRGQLPIVSMGCAAYQLMAGKADVGFCNCAAGLVKHYRLLGFRTYAGKLIPTPDGISVPLVIFPSDSRYFTEAGAFVGAFVNEYFGGKGRPHLDLGRWSGVLDTNAAPVRFDPDVVLERVSDFRQAETETPTILDALSEETVTKLSARGFLLNLSAGQLLTEKSLKQRELFIIIEGGFEVHDGGRRLRLIGPGDVIGEIGFFGSSGRRTASVTAVTDGQVLALRRHFVDELMKTDPAGAAEILFQLARALADRQYL